MRSNVLLAPPSSEPVTLEEFKAQARIASSADDALLTTLLKAARQWAEAYTRRAFMRQTWGLYLTQRPLREKVELPRAPLLGVTSVRFYDDKDQATVWGAENYFVDTASQPGALVLREGASWPEAQRCANGLMIEYAAGYGEEEEDVPETLRLAILQLATHWYEHRGEAASSQTYAKPPLVIEALLAPFRLLTAGGACA